MALIQPFKGIRYNPDRIDALADVVSPPYDVISPSAQTKFHARSPYNVIRMELGRERPGDDNDNNPHTRARDYLQRWLGEGVLIQETQPAFYVTATTFDTRGGETTRWGLMARVRLEPFGQGSILPHERTYSMVKVERLSLMRACRANLSPIFAFFSDPSAILPQLVSRVAASPPTVEFDDFNNHHLRMWVVTDPDLHRHVVEPLKQQPLFIADGHHRYETAISYRDALVKAEGGLPHDHPANYTLMYLSSAQDPGLVILPAHRMLPRVDPGLRHVFLERAEAFFHVERLKPCGKSKEDLRALLARLEQTAPGGGLIVAIRDEDAPFLLDLKKDCKDTLYPETTPEVMRDIDVTLLTDVVFPQFIGLPSDHLDDVERVLYDHDASRVLECVASGRCDMAFIIKPTPIAKVQQIADAGRIMPRKSTYFAPKVITGLVMHALY